MELYQISTRWPGPSHQAICAHDQAGEVDRGNCSFARQAGRVKKLEDRMGELRLDGKVALVTGAGRGLGRSYVKLLAARGASVVVNDPGVGLRGEGGDEEPARQVAEEICAGGGNALANFDSVASEAGAAAAVARAVDGFGRIDIIVNNAGIFMPERDFLQTSSESFTRLWRV